MKLGRKQRAAGAVGVLTLALASTLTACSGADDKTPTEVIKEYATALNEGDFETALALVAEPGDVSADDVLKLDGIDVPEPKAVDTEYGEDEEALSLKYDVGGAEMNLGFVKDDDGWKVREPQFLTDTQTALAPGSNNGESVQGLVDAGSQITTDDGVNVLDKRYIVVVGEQEDIPLTISFPGNDYVEGQEFEAHGSFGTTDGPSFSVYSDVDRNEYEWVITDSFYEEMKTFAMNEPPKDRGEYEESVAEFAAKDECEVVGALDVTNTDPTFTVECAGGTLRNTYTESYESVDGPKTKGETEDRDATFNVKVENGEITDV